MVSQRDENTELRGLSRHPPVSRPASLRELTVSLGVACLLQWLSRSCLADRRPVPKERGREVNHRRSSGPMAAVAGWPWGGVKSLAHA